MSNFRKIREVKNPIRIMRKKILITTILLVSSLSIWAQSKYSNIPTDKLFFIQLAKSNGQDSCGIWDIQSKSSFFKKTIGIQLWNIDGLRLQKFSMKRVSEDGYFEIFPINDENLRVSVDSITSNDSQPVKLTTRNNKPNQQFLFKHSGNGHFKIFDRYGRALGVADCSSKSGSTVVVSKPDQNFCSDWCLIEIVTKKVFVPAEDNSRGISTMKFIENKKIMKLIASGKENEIKDFFRNITSEELLKTDNGTIVRAFSKLNSNDKVTHTIWILEEVKNRQIEIREYVYTELEKVDFNKPTIVLKHLINNYFTNYHEDEAALAEKLSALQRKMNR